MSEEHIIIGWIAREVRNPWIFVVCGDHRHQVISDMIERGHEERAKV
jgi:hypothetical protein